MKIAIALDTAKPHEVAQVKLRQGERGSTELYFIVSDDGYAIDLSEYDEVRFMGAYPGGIVNELCTVDDEGRAALVIPESMTKEPGEYSLAYLKLITEDSAVITSQVVDIDVLPGVRGE